MMKFLRIFSNSVIKRGALIPSIVRVSFYSSKRRPSLYERLQKCDENRVSVIPALDQWVAQGGKIRQQSLEGLIANFREHRRYTPALEIVEWMRRRRRYAITPRLAAVRIDLLSKVHGLKKVNKYFKSLRDGLVNLPVCLALLNCYAEAKYSEKAEATMKYVRRFDSLTALPYNTMLRLYSTKREHVKLDAMIQEMQDKGIVYDKLTYKILLETYAQSDLERMEKLLMKMESDGRVSLDFYSYAAATKGYLKVGALDKAFVLVKKAESLIPVHERSSVYLCLISWYATMQKTEDMLRVWCLLLKFGNLCNDAYICMISSLAKLDDLDGAGKILEEWEGTTKTFDIQIKNLVIHAYCKKGSVGDAEVILKRVMDTGQEEPNAQTWSHMALGYFKNSEMEKAVEMEKKAFMADLPGWNPDLIVVAGCLEYLQSKGDAEGMQEILVLVEKYSSSLEGVKKIMGRFSSKGKPILVTDYYIPFFTSFTSRI